MKKRVFLLPAAALVIAALCVYRMTQSQQGRGELIPPPAAKQPAPLFEAYNQDSELVKFERYLGRHRVLVVFYDGERGAHENPVLRQLAGHPEQVKSSHAVVVGVSTALPQENERAIERMGSAFPGQLLTDLDLEIHRKWGRFDPETEKPIPGVFLVDRTGRVAFADGVPQPVAEVDPVLEELFGIP